MDLDGFLKVLNIIINVVFCTAQKCQLSFERCNFCVMSGYGNMTKTYANRLHVFISCQDNIPSWCPGGDPHLKVTGVLIVLLWGVNYIFWSHLGCLGWKVTTQWLPITRTFRENRSRFELSGAWRKWPGWKKKQFSLHSEHFNHI